MTQEDINNITDRVNRCEMSKATNKKLFTVNKGSLVTTYAPPAEKYSKKNAEDHIRQMVKALDPIEWTCVTEPWDDGKKRKSEYHFHLWCWWGKRKQIYQSTIEKLKAATKNTGQSNGCVDFTKPAGKGRDHLQKLLNDAKYAAGKSAKTKSKHDVFQSEGFHDLLVSIETDLNTQKILRKETGADSTNKSHRFFSQIMTGVTFFQQLKAAKEELANTTTKAKVFDWIIWLVDNKKKLVDQQDAWQDFEMELAIQELPPIILRDWQNEADTIIEATEPGRICNVFVDEDGGAGKTTFQKKRQRQNGALSLRNGKTGDIAKAYRNQAEVNFNFPKSQNMWNICYNAIEDLLDGQIFNSKYGSHMKDFIPCKVNLFCNSMPKLTGLSLDRWRIWKIINGKLLEVDIAECLAPKKTLSSIANVCLRTVEGRNRERASKKRKVDRLFGYSIDAGQLFG